MNNNSSGIYRMGRKVFLLLLFLSTNMLAFSQEQIQPNNLFSSSSGWIYNFSNITTSYRVQISSISFQNGISFKWHIDGGVDYRGSISMNKMALDSATQIRHYFADSTKRNYNDVTSLFVSRKVFKSLISGKNIAINLDKSIVNFSMIEFQKLKIVFAEKETQLDVVYAEGGNGVKLWILKDVGFPLILKLETTYTIELFEILE